MTLPQSGKSFRSLVGQAPSHPTTKDSVLVIVDAQNEYDHGQLAIVDVKSSRAVIGDVLKKYRDVGGDVVHVLHDTPTGAPVFTPDHELAEEFSELGGKNEKVGLDVDWKFGFEKVIHKQFPSSFTDTDLKEYVEKTGKKKVVVTGYMAHVCVSSTTRAGDELGFDMSVVKDGIGDRDVPGASGSKLVETVCAELGDSFATIIESKDL